MTQIPQAGLGKRRSLKFITDLEAALRAFSVLIESEPKL
jgi:hypothetical protein